MHNFIKISKLTKTYYLGKKPIPVLQGIDLELQRGTMVSIIGVSGVGKSTFLQVLGTLDRPSSGNIYFNGKDIFQQTDKELARFRNKTIGFVYQFHHLLPEFTAIENVMLPAIIANENLLSTKENAKRILNEVGLSHRLIHKPGELSGGEQQRVAIARAFIMNPELILADEPTGNLDRKTAQGIEDLMLELNQKYNTTFILATHNEELASRLNITLRLSNGIL